MKIISKSNILYLSQFTMMFASLAGNGETVLGFPKKCGDASSDEALARHELRYGTIQQGADSKFVFRYAEVGKQGFLEVPIADNVGYITDSFSFTDTEPKSLIAILKVTPEKHYVIAQVQKRTSQPERIVTCISQKAIPRDTAQNWIDFLSKRYPTIVGTNSLIKPEDANLAKYIHNTYLSHDIPPSQAFIEELLSHDKVPKLIRDFLENEEKRILSQRPPGMEMQRYLETYVQGDPHSYAAQKLLAQAKVFAQLQHHEKAKHFPFEDIWRFAIDGDRQIMGAYAFEEEPGYIRGALNGLAFALNTYGETSDASWYARVHDESVKGAKKIVDGALVEQTKGYKSDPKICFTYAIEELDSDALGMEDVKIRNSPRGKTKNVISRLVIDPMPRISSCAKEEDRKIITDNLFLSTHNYLKQSTSPEGRLLGYLWLARELELNHMFSDANGRSSNFALLAMILKDKDLPMLMFENPNVLDINGPEKLLVRVLEGMDNFEKSGRAKTFKKSGEMSLKNIKFVFNSAVEKIRQNLIAFLSDNKQNWKYWHNLIDPEA